MHVTETLTPLGDRLTGDAVAPADVSGTQQLTRLLWHLFPPPLEPLLARDRLTEAAMRIDDGLKLLAQSRELSRVTARVGGVCAASLC